VYEIVRM